MEECENLSARTPVLKSTMETAIAVHSCRVYFDSLLAHPNTVHNVGLKRPHCRFLPTDILCLKKKEKKREKDCARAALLRSDRVLQGRGPRCCRFASARKSKKKQLHKQVIQNPQTAFNAFGVKSCLPLQMLH